VRTSTAVGASNSGAASEDALTSWRRDGVSGHATNGGGVVDVGATVTVVLVVDGDTGVDAVAALVVGVLVVGVLVTAVVTALVTTCVDVVGAATVPVVAVLPSTVERDVAVAAVPGATLPEAQALASTNMIATGPTNRLVGAEHARRVVKRCAPTRRVMVLRPS